MGGSVVWPRHFKCLLFSIATKYFEKISLSRNCRENIEWGHKLCILTEWQCLMLCCVNWIWIWIRHYCDHTGSGPELGPYSRPEPAAGALEVSDSASVLPLVHTDHVTWILACDWSRLYRPLVLCIIQGPGLIWQMQGSPAVTRNIAPDVTTIGHG